MIGREIAHYRITAKLGEGGMGEVYRASDSRLGREVAIKVLPEAVAEDSERLARFEREAQLLAAMNHPGIAQIHGLETSGSTRALVMELVPGATLAERIERGALPLDEALGVARQIAEALEYAHEKGVVHRDLKPANVKLTPEGKVKVLDFGLAKAMDPATDRSGPGELAHSPTLTMGATVQGVILGTAGYMAPEQAKALPVDKRADIWAFGVILHEMLTGELLFAGDTVGDTLAAVIRADIDLEALPAEAPPALRRLVRRCLERKPANRLRDVGDARIVLDELLAGGVGEERGAPPAIAAARPRGAWAPWALAVVATAVAAWALLQAGAAGPAAGTLSADLAIPSDQRYFFQGDWGSPVILAPDGESIVYGAQATEGSSSAVLWTRSLATGAEHPIEGTAGGYAPFYSPDGRSVGFFAEGKLKIAPVDGGPALTLAETVSGRGGAWAPDGTIVFSPAYRAGLFVVSARGGEPRPLTQVDTSRHSSHRWPTLTADGKGVVFLAVHHSPEFEKDAGLRFVRLDGGDEHAVLPARANGAIVGDRLLYLRETTLFAQRFDAASGELRGEPASIVRNVQFDITTWRATFTASPRRLIYAPGNAAGGSRLSWLDRSGRLLQEVAKTAVRGDLRLSPDGTRVVESRGDRREDLWMIDLERGAEGRFTFEDDLAEWSPVWSPDGRFVYYVSTNHPDLRDRIFRKRSDGTGAPELVYESTPELDLAPNAISPDGGVLALTVGTSPFDSDADIALLPVDGSSPPRRLFETPYQEVNPRFSHDGRFLVYSTQESGTSQVMVVAVDRSGDAPRVTAKWQASVEGGGQSAWSAKDDEIVFLDPNNNLMSVAVTDAGDGTLRFGAPTVLFSTSAIAIRRSIALAADGRVLVNHFGEERSEPLKLIENWASGLYE
ncbi:MAG: serine/threonine-protein kinase [Holophagales bacterium]|nr:serine/threonine-protein kinase [Holophagales bacterium]